MKYCRLCESGFDLDGHLNLYVVDFLSNSLCKKSSKHKRAVVVFIPDCAGIAERFPTVMTERTRTGDWKGLFAARMRPLLPLRKGPVLLRFVNERRGRAKMMPAW